MRILSLRGKGVRSACRCRGIAGLSRLVLAAVCLGAGSGQAAFEAEPGPLTDQHLAIIRPADFRNATGGPAPTAQSKDAVFGTAARLAADPLRAACDVRFAGDYAVWVRIGQASGERQPVLVDLAAAGRPVLSGRINEGAGGPGRGGQAGLRDYVNRAHANTPKSAAVKDIHLHMDHQGELKVSGKLDKNAADAGTIADDFLVEMKTGTADQWTTIHRLEKPGDGGYYWWKAGQIALTPGSHELSVNLVKESGKGAAPLVDAVILTGATNLLYPYAPDISAPRGSYVRFRIDRLPPGGVTLSMDLLTHIYPTFYSGKGHCNPEGFRTQALTPHTRTGYTRWYCIQDLEHTPGPGHGGHQAFHLRIGGGKEIAGATQFAMLPFQDEVVREFDWNEPSGRNISMLLDFEKHPEQLRTFRDHAREHYEEALKAGGGRLFPLTRQDLALHTGGGGDDGSIDYTAKTLRLLGLNSGGVREYARAFGLAGFGGGTLQGSWQPGQGEETGRQNFTKAYEGFRKLGTNVLVVQMCDEPGEAFGTSLSAPLWVWEEPAKGPSRWMDYAGGSELNTRFLGYSNCVLEGTFERFGNFDWRVGCDNATNPATYGLWRIGKVNPYLAPENLAYSLVVKGDEKGRCAVVHKAADAKSGSFKLVWDGPRAALFLNNSLLAQLDGVPASGGFGIACDQKAITGLRVRPLRRAERLGREETLGLASGAGPSAAGLELEDELVSGDRPDWQKPKPLKAYVEEDWAVGGGLPGVPAAYQAWLKEQGAEPALFGKTAPDQLVPMLIPELATTPEMRRAYYWGRRYSGYLTPRLFALAMDGMRANAPRPDLRAYAALSGDSVDLHQTMALDMFQLAQYTNGLMPGISDWSTARWSEQAGAFNAAFFNAGARRFGAPPASRIMMHCVHPSVFRAYTCLGNNVKYLSFYTFGPLFVQAYTDWWSDRYHGYPACSLVNNRVTQVDDLVAPGLLRPSRVAQLHAMSAHYWGDNLFPDKRLTFLALAHDYYQPELVSEDHVAAGALEHFDALYVLDRHVAGPARDAIRAWVERGGLLWLCADAGTLNEYNEPDDLLKTIAGAVRTFAPAESEDKAKAKSAAKDAPKPPPVTVRPVPGESEFQAHTVVAGVMPESLAWDGARVRAVYDDGRSAWLEKPVGKGRVVYVGHRAGQTYAAKILRHWNWSDVGRALLAAPLREAAVGRELWLSEPCFMAYPLSATGGTVVVLYNMQPAPRQGVTLHLKESRKPSSVQMFDEYRLVPLDHAYADGVVAVELPPFAGAQMLVVRNAPAPDDYARKLADLRAQAESLLASTDNARDLSAGAFLAAADPAWGLAGRVAGLIGHESWLVRRQAAETLGRLGYTAAGDALAAAAARETDAHALAEQVLALARLKHPKARDLVLAHVEDESIARSIHLKRMCVLAAGEFLFGAGAETNRPAPAAADAAFGMKVAESALRETDVRVRREGIRLLGRLDPSETLRRALQDWPRDAKARPVWIEAIARNPGALETYLAQNCPGGDALFLGVAAAAQDPGLARALEARLAALTTNSPQGAAFASALAKQDDQDLVLEAMRRRAELPAALVAQLPYLLDRLFNARLGPDLRDWDRWLQAGGPE